MFLNLLKEYKRKHFIKPSFYIKNLRKKKNHFKLIILENLLRKLIIREIKN